MICSLLVGIKHADAGLQEKTAQDGFVARSLAAHRKSSAQFSQYDERQPDLIGELDRLYHGTFPGKGRCSDSRRAPASPPHLFVNGVLRGHGLIKGGIFASGAYDIAEVAQSAAPLRNANAPGQGLKRYFVQAFILFTGSPAKSFVQSFRHVADSVLHAYIVGIAGNDVWSIGFAEFARKVKPLRSICNLHLRHPNR